MRIKVLCAGPNRIAFGTQKTGARIFSGARFENVRTLNKVYKKTCHYPLFKTLTTFNYLNSSSKNWMTGFRVIILFVQKKKKKVVTVFALNFRRFCARFCLNKVTFIFLSYSTLRYPPNSIFRFPRFACTEAFSSESFGAEATIEVQSADSAFELYWRVFPTKMKFLSLNGKIFAVVC